MFLSDLLYLFRTRYINTKEHFLQRSRKKYKGKREHTNSTWWKIKQYALWSLVRFSFLYFSNSIIHSFLVRNVFSIIGESIMWPIILDDYSKWTKQSLSKLSLDELKTFQYFSELRISKQPSSKKDIISALLIWHSKRTWGLTCLFNFFLNLWNYLSVLLPKIPSRHYIY